MLLGQQRESGPSKNVRVHEPIGAVSSPGPSSNPSARGV